MMHMYIYIFIAALVLFISGLLSFFNKKRRLADLVRDRYSAAPLLTPTEAAFYPTLESIAARHDYLLYIKVRLADIARTARADDYNTYMKYFGKVKAKHVDFVLCDRDFFPRVVVELDDKSHENKRNYENDLLKDAVLESIGISVVRIPVADSYNRRAIERKIFRYD